MIIQLFVGTFIINFLLMLYFMYQYLFGVELHDSKYTNNIHIEKISFKLIEIEEEIKKLHKINQTILNTLESKGKNDKA